MLMQIETLKNLKAENYPDVLRFDTTAPKDDLGAINQSALMHKMM